MADKGRVQGRGRCVRCVGGTYTTWDSVKKRYVRVTCGACGGRGQL